MASITVNTAACCAWALHATYLFDTHLYTFHWHAMLLHVLNQKRETRRGDIWTVSGASIAWPALFFCLPVGWNLPTGIVDVGEPLGGGHSIL